MAGRGHFDCCLCVGCLYLIMQAVLNIFLFSFFLFFFFFFCVPQLFLWGSPLLGEIFAYVPVF